MSLQDQVEQVFAPGDVLARSVTEFNPRPGQLAMAQAVARTIEHGGALVVEAGTGVGKTFSYLVPALLSGERVLLSTATKTLQDQLFGRDLPQLAQVLGLPVRVALLKGRGSYLCAYRLELARHDASLSGHGLARGLARIEQWAQHTRSGDLAELPGLDERSPLIALVTSTRDNCLGSSCPKARECHVNLARREAMAAEVVVVNHHLFFADLVVRESGMAELLPSVRCVIFDEAHQLNETGVQFLGRRLGTSQVLDFAKDMLACGLQQARGLADWSQLASSLDRAARDLRLGLSASRSGLRMRWVGDLPEGANAQAWSQALQALQAHCLEAVAALSLLRELGPDIVRLHERAIELVSLIEVFQGSATQGCVRWLDVDRQLRLVESPLDIAQAVQTRLLGPEGQGKSWVFTSATLGDDDELSWFTGPCGLGEAEKLRVESPFDYSRQASLYVPRELPKPADPAHSQQVAALVARLARNIGGRTLVLTTSLRALRSIGEALAGELGDGGELGVLMQGQLPKSQLLDQFRNASQPGQRGCILVASASFWEGVDIPGQALQMVVIDKLPFPAPEDPLVQARTRRLEQEGRHPFKDYFVAEAAVALKQGAGRLIRRETDQGALVICDTRLLSMGYGRRLLAALPPMRRLDTEQQLLAVLEELNRTRTGSLDPA